ncbi:MAG TPA: phytanoyl-CoA dioxygenase family protein, partial [Acidimicrobiales bacterium]|nr:phytanoyl-CoA dioxygenase family protein [Acidimicrobiales bacterium]
MPEEALPPFPTATFQLEPTSEQVEHFAANGFVSVPRITTDEEVEWLGVVYDLLFEKKAGAFKGGYFDLARAYDAEGDDLLPQVLSPEHRFPQLRETVYVRNARRMASALLGVDETSLHGWGHMILKPAMRGHETPWHQDEAYWPADKAYTAVGAWMPLDDASIESGCLHFVPGSHRGPVLSHHHIGDDPSVHGLEADDADTTGAVAVPIPAGAATFHHPRMIHYAGPNTTSRARRAYANEFQLAPVEAEIVDQ